jgi:hypothetical protein
MCHFLALDQIVHNVYVNVARGVPHALQFPPATAPDALTLVLGAAYRTISCHLYFALAVFATM